VQFASPAYLGFVAVAVAVYFALPWIRARNAWLLLASYAFYWSIAGRWTGVLLSVTVLGYVFGLLVGRAPARSRAARAWLATGIVLTVATLAFFKYGGITAGLLDSVWELAGARGPALELLLPVGISFWTFMTVGYLVDVYRGDAAPTRDPLAHALFVGFFGHVTAGPIGRAGQLLGQLAEKRRFGYEAMRTGLLLMLLGFFRKLVIADPLGVVVDAVYKDPHRYGAQPIVITLATLAFALQIYFDFSGYTDIVRGTAKLFGIDLLPNFDRPYFSASVKEFWRRWHMSLMGWFKDYLYIPLGGSRRGRLRRYGNILIVFLVSGVWHGAGWTFVAWGLLNAAYQIAGELLAPARDRVAGLVGLSDGGAVRRVLAILTTFALTTGAWVLFRSETLADARYIVGKIVRPELTGETLSTLLSLGLTAEQLAVASGAAALVLALEALSFRVDLGAWLASRVLPLRWALYQAALLAVVIFGYYGPVYDAAAFAYFKF